ncbi:delta-aminolevulinic acid dehydratase [Verticillium dahliae]|nr:delta-aminolevulinic acid dehydratase [Verticillium dahliae]
MSFSSLVQDLSLRDSGMPRRPGPRGTASASTIDDGRSQVSRAMSYASTAATSVSISGDISSQLHGGYHHPLARSWQAERQLTKARVAVASTTLVPFLETLVHKGLRSVMLFGVPLRPVLRTLLLFICTDVCLCEYTSHGHCGILRDDGTLNNALSVDRISDVAVAYARAGAHCVAPSDMNDGRIRAIKLKLIEEGISHNTVLMSYAAKFSGCFFLPAVAGLARRAITRDINEGADIIMVKPASQYLDIISDAKDLDGPPSGGVPRSAGEFAMIHAGAKAGVFDLKTMAFESTEGILRAGATIIVSYFTPDFLDWLSN